VKGKGGVFKLTAGLQREFDPIASITRACRSRHCWPCGGHGHTRAQAGVEVQFFDYIWPAMHQLRNEVSLLRWRSNGSYSARW